MPQRLPAGGDDDRDADEPAPLTPKQIATLLDASRRAIILELEALVPHGDYRPIPGSWCPNEVVGHLIEAEKRGFAWRIRLMIAEGRRFPKLAEFYYREILKNYADTIAAHEARTRLRARGIDVDAEAAQRGNAE